MNLRPPIPPVCLSPIVADDSPILVLHPEVIPNLLFLLLIDILRIRGLHQ